MNEDNQSPPNVLDVRAITVAFGGLRALTDVSAAIDAAHIVAVIGPNGAGKTTFLNAICGLARTSGGEIRHRGVDMTNAHPTAIACGGLGRSFQDPKLIDSATVLDNVLCGAHQTIGYSLAGQIFRRFEVSRAERRARTDARELLGRFGLADLADVEAGRLPYGSRKMVDIVRATIARPSVLLLDEPSSGLDPAERARIRDMLLEIHTEFGIPMVVVEHHMDLVRAIADRVLGLVSGSVALHGPTDEVLDSDEFRVTMAGGRTEANVVTADV
ncbi:ABC transporter ATP-binding protein [Nocardia jiangxiensis]|uniref:ABC transporter ATP-binding protein n=1 Tax=Nocardia jiangxiensis TaxID=282685 RepID=A0ABW6RRD7_9NOCA|nr:ATP-binding cassette domain-containing protein [Nocardia jiangxiensis]